VPAGTREAAMSMMRRTAVVLVVVAGGLAQWGIANGDQPERATGEAPAVSATPMMIAEAKLPEGFPPPGPVGEVVVKTYPQHRLARTTTAGPGRGDDGMFMRLFGHIKRNDIAMTAPVTMDWSADPAAGPRSMAFLYGAPGLGQPGPDPADGAVVVEDIPETTVVSVGMRGGYGEKPLRAGLDTLETWLAGHPEWTAAGPPRMLGYNSPFVPWFLKYAEVQLPVVRSAPTR
jgi:hypothetical protein